MTAEKASDELHPSYLELDRFALGTHRSESTRAHVETCPQCREHVARVSVQPAPPDWLRNLPHGAPTPAPRYNRWLRVALPVAAAAALAMVITSRRQGIGPTAPDSDSSYVGTKGMPEVWVYVKRGASIELWRPGAPLIPGDTLRLKIDAGGLPHVDVFAPDDGGGYRKLWSGDVTKSGPMTLPVAWTVDARPGQEQLVVIGSRHPVDARQVGTRLRDADDAAGWTRLLVFPKAVGDGAAP